ncbi:MAG: carbohydrate porin [Halieaceae bacterium]|nr:carbohydrate porin [Halieaceae bacterium]
MTPHTPAIPAPSYSLIQRRPISSLLASILATVALAAQAEEDRKLNLLVTGDYLNNTDGGIREADRFLSNVDLWTRWQPDSWRGKDLSVYVHGSYNEGESFSADVVGDTQIVSSIEANQATRLYQAYIEHGSETEDRGLLFGLWDLNSRIDVIEPALLFVNSSHGIGAEFALSGERGPSIFPVTALALYGHTRVGDRTTLRGAILDGVAGGPERPARTDIDLSESDGALLVAEGSYRVDERWIVKAGAWHYTSDFEVIDGDGGSEYSNGIYGSLAGEILPGTLSTWVRYGVASEEVQAVGSYFGTGLVWDGIPGDLNDRAGIAVAAAFAGEPLRDRGASRAETNIELTYSVQVTPWLRLQPDIQYIFNPGLDEGLDNALVIGLRIELFKQVIW